MAATSWTHAIAVHSAMVANSSGLAATCLPILPTNSSNSADVGTGSSHGSTDHVDGAASRCSSTSSVSSARSSDNSSSSLAARATSLACALRAALLGTLLLSDRLFSFLDDGVDERLHLTGLDAESLGASLGLEHALDLRQAGDAIGLCRYLPDLFLVGVLWE